MCQSTRSDRETINPLLRAHVNVPGDRDIAATASWISWTLNGGPGCQYIDTLAPTYLTLSYVIYRTCFFLSIFLIRSDAIVGTPSGFEPPILFFCLTSLDRLYVPIATGHRKSVAASRAKNKRQWSPHNRTISIHYPWADWKVEPPV